MIYENTFIALMKEFSNELEITKQEINSLAFEEVKKIKLVNNKYFKNQSNYKRNNNNNDSLI